MATSPARAPLVARKHDRKYYLAMALVASAVVLYGFSRTYFLRSFSDLPALPSIVHVHGFIFSLWIALFVTQTALVSGGRTDIHRRLGIFGGILAATMIVVGPLTAINAARLGRTPPGPPPLVFLAVPLFDILVFVVLIAAGFYFRRKPDFHKRLMLLATFSILPAAFARFPFVWVRAHVPTSAFVLMNVLLIVAVAIDVFRHRRLHPVFLWGGLVVLISYPVRMMIAGTGAWMSFATWLTR